jgi:hypothetical protein
MTTAVADRLDTVVTRLRKNLPPVAEQTRESRSNQQHRRWFGIRRRCSAPHGHQHGTAAALGEFLLQLAFVVPQRHGDVAGEVQAEAFVANFVAEARTPVREQLRGSLVREVCAVLQSAAFVERRIVVVAGTVMRLSPSLRRSDTSGECSLIDACPSELMAATLNRSDRSPSRLGPSPKRSHASLPASAPKESA